MFLITCFGPRDSVFPQPAMQHKPPSRGADAWKKVQINTGRPDQHTRSTLHPPNLPKPFDIPQKRGRIPPHRREIVWSSIASNLQPRGSVLPLQSLLQDPEEQIIDFRDTPTYQQAVGARHRHFGPEVALRRFLRCPSSEHSGIVLYKHYTHSVQLRTLKS